MRYIMIITSITASLLLSACQNAADLERQKNLVDQTSKTYAVTQEKATQEAPKKYEFCGNEQYPCPVLTNTHIDTKENPSHENP